jgi:hypothetical protein
VEVWKIQITWMTVDIRRECWMQKALMSTSI